MLLTIVAVLGLALQVHGYCLPENTTCWPSAQQFADLNMNITGSLTFPGESGYAAEAKLRDTWFPSNPGVIAMVTSTADIQTCVLFARRFNIRVTVKSSGHDFLGRSTARGSLMIHTQAINAISINTNQTSRSQFGEIRVGTGNTWKDIYRTLNGTGRVVVGGSSPTVSPGGYTQGGGHSPLSKMYGLAVDNVLEMEVVLPDGRIATSTEGRTVIRDLDGGETTVADGDLFWALRGGGGGTYGIVPYYTYKLHPDADGMVTMLNVIDLARTPDGGTTQFPGYVALAKVNELMKTLPDDYSGYVLLNNFEAKPGYGYTFNGAVYLSLIKFGAWDSTTQAIYNQVRDLNPDTQDLLSATNKTNFWDYQKDVPVEAEGSAYLQNSLLQESSFTTSLTNLIMNYFLMNNVVLRAPISCTHTILGGAVGNAAVNSTPLHPGWRTTRSSFSCGIGLPDYDEKKKNEYIQYAKSFGTELRQLGSGEYLNEPDYYNADWKRDYWNDNYDALNAIKQRYDPNNFFTCYHCVGSTFPTPGINAAVPTSSSTGVLVLLALVTALQTF